MTTSRAPTRLLVVSDFNAANLEAILKRSVDPLLAPLSGPLGNVFQVLLEPPPADTALVWTRPEAVIPSFAALLAHEPVTIEAILLEVDRFIDALIHARDRISTIFVASWLSPSYRRGLGVIDLKSSTGISRALLQMNARLVEALAPERDIFVLDATRWLLAAGPRGDAPAGWYTAKIPYSPDTFRIAAKDIQAALRGLQGGAKKLLVLDLDDTLWGGILGDAGWEGLVLGGHDARGEAFQDFQRGLKALTRRGIVLAIASKNDEAVVLDAMERHPEMVLRRADFATWRINWNDKADNIAQIAEELNLGLSHTVFIDDNPAERGRVREALSEVLVPDWPSDPRNYVHALAALDCFDTPALSDEDRTRTSMYVAERERQAVRISMPSVDEWLESLELVVAVEPLTRVTLPRATQLLNKTNQMNLTTRRLSESELDRWVAEPNRFCWTVSVTDRFGDAGLTGLVSVSTDGGDAELTDFVLSCRVFGRRIEEAMLHVAVEYVRTSGAHRLHAPFRPTQKNKPTLEFLTTRSGLLPAQEHRWLWDCERSYPLPGHITLRQRP